MNFIIENLKDLFTLPILFLFIFIGVFLLLVDVPLLKRKKYDREALMAKLLGYAYIAGSIAVYFMFQII
ncbi:CLC_0170 family protein [Alkaliphilus serpentinus]|uniref:Uncharacterized protein n=1 Tax=Alkaliphilus serpentinus TaxID=1482731 RepID=A0A833MF20_9FIRM|nr:CLC_0170 family protein [Alkaliphilus serpentinus]KAB3532483.1 hypothetical protein F8153_02275 [Alkaliphilus serpentinus]